MRFMLLTLLLLAAGCTSPEQRIARAVDALTPVVAELPSLGPGGDVTVVFIMPNFGRPWWQMPFTASDVGSHETYVILIGGTRDVREAADRVAAEAAGLPAE